MDTMLMRRQGSPKNPVLMSILMIIMRFCLAAHFVGKDAKTVLGPNGHRLKRLFERTHLSPIMMWCIIRDPSQLIGIGGQSVVVHRAGYVEKYNYTLAGADRTVLQTAIRQLRLDQAQLEKQFGNIVQPTTFGIGTLPLRWPFCKLQTTYSRQQQLHTLTDIFSIDAQSTLKKPTSQLKHEATLLTRGARIWMEKNKWLDLVGPSNIVITADYGQPSIRILDTGPYAAEYITDCNPVLGRPYRDIFMERLRTLETFSGITPAILILLAASTVGLYAFTHHLNPQHVYAFLDAIEDRFIG